MPSISDLRPGDLGFGPVGGWFQAPDVIGQFILGEGFAVGDVQVGHVFVVTQGINAQMIVPNAVEAMPGGAIEVPIPERWTSRFAYVRLPEDYPGQATDAAAIARAMIGTPYSFASYAALAAWRFGRKPPAAEGPGMRKLEAWIDRRRPLIKVPGIQGDPASPLDQLALRRGVRLPAEAICSVLADQAWTLAGKQVMPAGTPHQCVTPGALAKALLEMDGAKWMWPR